MHTIRSLRTSSRASPGLTSLAACLSAALGVIGTLHAEFVAEPRQVPMTLAVDTCADDGSAGALRQVVASAPSGSTIDLGPLTHVCGPQATIVLTSNEISIAQDYLTLQGPADGSGSVTISGNHASRVLKHSGIGWVTLMGITVADGAVTTSGNHGGGCIESAGSVGLVRSTVTGCQAASKYGGGVYAKNAVTLLLSTLSNNEVWNGTGGGVATASLTSKYSNITANSETGVGLYQYSAGGAYVGTGGARIEGTTFDSNTSWGTGALVLKSNATIVNSTVSMNVSSGPAVTLAGDISVTISSSTIAFNYADGNAGSNVGGIKLSDPWDATATLTLESSIVANNTNGFDYRLSDIGCFGQNRTLSGSNNIVKQLWTDCPVPADFAVSTDPMLRPLASNGGPTRTHALMPGSPAIAHGSNMSSRLTDQRGSGYPRSTTTTSGTTTDVGAYEFDSVFVDGFE